MSSPIYSLLNVRRIIAGPGSLSRVHEIPASYGARKILMITDQGVWDAGLIEKPKEILESAGYGVEIIHQTPPEPAVDQVKAIFREAQEQGGQMIIGIGGGSVMDVAKLVSVLLTNDLSLEQLIGGAEITRQGLPTLMVPTTAGTGSEVTQNAIVLVPEEQVKVGIVSSKLVPEVVILDPLLTVKLPPAITAATGMDALAHAIECYISKKANPFSDTFALKTVSLISKGLRRAYKNGQDIEAREEMLLGALFGGLCIATSGTTAVHALAYPLGGRYRIPHGLSNAVLLPHVMKFNLDATEDRFKDLALAMGLPVSGLASRQAAERMIENLYALNADLNIPAGITDWGVTEADLEELVESASRVTRLLDNNPRPMTKSDMRAIYRRLM
ncbi:MAG: iron-containing alcohol dehydrogenase [Deltaproteobacteria bacterium]|nr:iron-containing alcohol dehydrogenase [Deltaproteobacteria bacterium]